MIPQKIKIENSNLIIDWDDKTKSEINLSELRRACPCAYCENDRKNDHGKFEVYTDKQITIKEIKPVGTYALNIIWNDNHNTGFYEFALLKKMN